MSDLKKFFNEYRNLLERGDSLAVLEKYYDEDIIQIENGEEAIRGKAKCIEKEKEGLERVKSVEQKITAFVIDQQENIVMGEMLLQFDSKKFGRKRLEEAFVQKWKGDKIIYQRFYYNGFQDDHDKTEKSS